MADFAACLGRFSS